MRLIDANALARELNELREIYYIKAAKEAKIYYYDAFDTALRRIKYAPTITQWISVKDGLPTPKKDSRLLLDTDEEVIGFHCPISQAWLTDYHTIYQNVTHWMPLLEPPTEVQND